MIHVQTTEIFLHSYHLIINSVNSIQPYRKYISVQAEPLTFLRPQYFLSSVGFSME
jgi:hypothetical protein